jgi:hypothetical protein
MMVCREVWGRSRAISFNDRNGRKKTPVLYCRPLSKPAPQNNLAALSLNIDTIEQENSPKREELVEYLFIWAIFGIISGAVAMYKGRHGGVWYLIGLLLGPLSLILALVVPRPKK